MGVIKKVITKFIKKINSYEYEKKWRKRNPNNETFLFGLNNFDRITVGKGTYGNINVSDFNPQTGKSKLIIGNYCSIGGNVNFMLGGGHYLDRLTTYPFINKIYGKEESLDKGNIVLNDDVWIGNEVTIMSGVKIGQGAVIGTKALVTHDIPPYAIAAGIPAKIIKYRFDEKTIKKLLDIDISRINSEIVKKNIKLFEEKLDEDKVDKIKKILE